jgi:hypothetical protein
MRERFNEMPPRSLQYAPYERTTYVNFDESVINNKNIMYTKPVEIYRNSEYCILMQFFLKVNLYFRFYTLDPTLPCCYDRSSD